MANFTTSPFSPQVWFITGCSSGLGRAIADRVLAAGHQAVVTARNAQDIAAYETVPNALVLPLDVTKPDQIESAVAQAVDHFGKVDILVNNAGVGLLAAVEETSEAALDHAWQVNFLGPFRLLRSLASHFRQQGSGRVFTMSAAAVVAGYPGFAAYAAAKAALEAATEAFGLEMAPFQVKTCILQPGPFRTSFIQNAEMEPGKASEAFSATVGRFGKILASMPGKQPGDPEKLAELLLELAAETDLPLRLPLGKYMVGKSLKVLQERLNSAQKWQERAQATDF